MPTLSRRASSVLALLLTTGIASGLHCQGLPPPPERTTTSKPDPNAPVYTSFDVASIRENKSEISNSSWRTTPDGILMVNMHLDSLLGSAYHVKQDLITGGPSWITAKGWDIEAKVLPSDDGKPVKLTDAQQGVLLRVLLENRFGIKAHIETKTLPIYDLVVAKGGPKMQASPPPPPNPDAKTGDEGDDGSMMQNDGHIEAKIVPMNGFAQMLGFVIHHTVLDKTGLTGKYNFTLDFTPEEEAQSASNAAASGTEAHPPIFTALQEQLGLKLVPVKGPVDTLVVDTAELPTAN